MMLSDLAAAAVALTQRGKKHLHRLILVAMHACVPGPCRATYGRLSPRWPVEALGSLSFTSLCMCSCTKQGDLWSPVTSLAGDAEWCGSCVWGQRLVLNRVWQQGQWVNAPWAYAVPLTRLCEGRVGECDAMRGVLMVRVANLDCGVVAMTLHRLVARHCMSSCTAQTHVMSSVTSLAGGAGWRE